MNQEGKWVVSSVDKKGYIDGIKERPPFVNEPDEEIKMIHHRRNMFAKFAMVDAIFIELKVFSQSSLTVVIELSIE